MKFAMEIPLEHYATNQQLVESICDLTRKIGLLEDLMEAARERRMSREKARFADGSSSEFSVQA